MFKWITGGLVCTALALPTSGCSKAPQSVMEQTGPLSLDEWKQMSGNEKYAEETMERLKQHDPSLKTSKGWKKFLATDMKAELAKDSPRNQP